MSLEPGARADAGNGGKRTVVAVVATAVEAIRVLIACLRDGDLFRGCDDDEGEDKHDGDDSENDRPSTSTIFITIIIIITLSAKQNLQE